MTYSERKQRIEVFLKTTESVRNWYPDVSDLAIQMIKYVEDSSALFPTIPLPSEGFYYLQNLTHILARLDEWDEFDIRILKIISHSNYWKNKRGVYNDSFEVSFFRDYMISFIQREIDSFYEDFLEKWKDLSFSEADLFYGTINHTNRNSHQFSNGVGWYNPDESPSSLGRYIIKKSNENFEEVFKIFNKDYDYQLLDLLIQHDPNFSDSMIPNFLDFRKNIEGQKVISTFSVAVLLVKNPEKYEALILEKIQQIESSVEMLVIFKLLVKYLPEKYESKQLEYIYMYLNKAKIEMRVKGDRFNGFVNGFVDSIDILLKVDASNSKNCLIDLFDICQHVQTKELILNKIFPFYKEQLLPSIFSGKGVISLDNWYAENYYRNLFKIIQTIDYEEYQPQVWEFIKSKSKKLRELAAVALSKLGEKSIPNAEKLLSEKKADARQTGALILSLIRTDKSQEILMNAIDSEKDDNTRDTMLEGVAGQLPTVFSQEEITQKVQKAKERNKLEKPLEWWLDESKLPPVYWKNTNQVIDVETIRFLFYRMSRTKDIRTDIEAKPLILSIDRTTSGNFAKSLIKTYFDNGADAKYKFCLTLSGLLGDDDVIDLMKRKVNEFAEGSRGKMAEYTVKALALQGSTKALRAVEFFSRKYKNKNKNIGAAANESFGIVAEELGITPYDLADSIIPNFDFDGLFREFEAGGETYRAFINTDFKIAYFNEDNKLMKSPPKAISKELAEEFKEISKEIRDIVKSQSGRLEQYLVIQRKWNAERWQEFFLGNPIMFAYAVRLIWGAYNAKGELQFVFRCEQDQTLIDENSDEIEIQEDLFVGMVHPISLTSESIEYWNTSLYDANIEAIFPQLKRPVVLLKEGDKNLKISEEFTGIKISGYTFVGKLEKMGWFRGSVVDGGGIASYYKDFSELGITAVVLQIGSIAVGYLEDNAEVGSLMFAKKGSVKFGSYMYDEPDKTTDSRLFAFGEVPPIVYSEVLADMMALKAIAIQ